jgi:hypothetical protein
MAFIVLEKYCKDLLEYPAKDLLGITKGQWHKYKKSNYLPLKHCKIICSHFNHHITDDMKELTDLITSAYYFYSEAM